MRSRFPSLRMALFLVLSFLAFTVSSTAFAEEKPSDASVMGKPGTIVLDKLLGISFSSSGHIGAFGGVYQAGMVSFSHQKQTYGSAETKTTSFVVAPSFDVFVTKHLTLGGTFSFGYQWQSSNFDRQVGGTIPTSGYDISVSPRVGYWIPISDSVALWPRLGATVGGSLRRSDVGAPFVEQTAGRVGASLDLDLALPLTKHLVFLVGPRIEASTVQTTEQANLGYQAFGVTAAVRGSLSYAF
jgi:hypothetical protein